MNKRKRTTRMYQQQVENIQKRLNNRPYSIGLDMGVGSIGWAVLAMEQNTITKKLLPTEVVLSGVRIFTPSTGASERRQARGQRNALRHKSNRLLTLWKILARKGLMLPFSNEQVANTADLRFSSSTQKLNPYSLRLTGLSNKLELEELGYAIYHLANHRGSSSVRSFLDAEVTPDEKKAQEQTRKTKVLAETYNLNTFVEVLQAYNKEQFKGYRNKNNRSDMPLPTRDIILSEIKTILDTQQRFWPEVLDKSYCDEIISAVNYENEKLVPEAGSCPYFPNESKLPKCHTLTEERRLQEAVNNARILRPHERNRTVVYIPEAFSPEEAKVLYQHLRNGKNLTVTTVRKLLPQYKEFDFTLQGKDKKAQEIKGFRFSKLEEKAFWSRLTEIQQDKFFSYWTNTADDRKLIHLLQNECGLSEDETTDALSSIQLIGDYAPIGKTATLLIRKYIDDGMTYTEAINRAQENKELPVLGKTKAYNLLPYYGEVLTESTVTIMGKAWHREFAEKRQTKGFKKPTTNADEETFGKISNPVVHQSLNELRKLINELITILGEKPEEFNLELARDIKVGQEKREKIIKDQATREREAERIYQEYCAPTRLPNARNYIRHFKLLEQQQFICPYCLKAINADMIFSGQADVDHILPKADTGDNSESNLVITHKSCNLEKGKRIPFAAFGSSPDWPAIAQAAENLGQLKCKRFLMNEEEYSEYLKNRGFKSRFSSDNSYISKVTQKYLSSLYTDHMKSKIHTLNGRESHILREAWNLQGLSHKLGALHLKSDDALENKKSRIDNRHHALDAIVAGFCSRSLVNSINYQSEHGMPAEKIISEIPIPAAFRKPNISREEAQESFRAHVDCALHLHTFISVKQDTSLSGKLLKDTSYTVMVAKGEKLVLLAKKSMKNMKIKDGHEDVKKVLLHESFAKNIPQGCSDLEKNRIEALLSYNRKQYERFNSLLEIAEQTLIELNIKAKEQGKRGILISDFSIAKKALDLCGGFYYYLQNNSREKIFVVREPSENMAGFAYDTGDNLCIDFYHDKQGKLCGEVIRKINSANKNFIPKYKKEGYRLLERIYQGDTLEIAGTNRANLSEQSTGAERVAAICTPNATHSRTFVKVVTFTEVGKTIQVFFSNLAKAKSEKDASFTIGSSLHKWNVRKVVLSPCGLVEYASQILRDMEPCGE